ncbi:glycosyl transferase [Aphanothece hegewaldii CCALA 016]|uniref:Beta-monoglucosyldiacylglycerol synthase n=1 Tax=Aphanothece hegewaldii CCALA 016 TaxID=2107694 RepID=A0A2T1LX88_9CHRO|nr:glycosyltransferase family 2 protein [Aphanothece hegewaldii]PSF36811.1 glycosyl transferase [Aphanothece hegewaldii CCALA 016]
MTKNYWSDESSEELDPISSLLSEWTDPEEDEEEFRSDFFQGLAGRRQKAAFVLITIWTVTIALHLVNWGMWVVLALTAIIVIQGLRLMLAKPEATPTPLSDEALLTAPHVSILVAAKNEEAVISRLVASLCNLDYPSDKYDVWMIDDASTDKTPVILDQLVEQYPQLNVIHRPANAGGGKSGALNQVLRLTKGDIIGVFDADALISADLLRSVVPMFEAPRMGAIQVRKAITNDGVNFWTKGQMAEMAVDSYYQQQRIAIGGMGELRGNGQFVRRTATISCGGWNEQTITDDLDLTIRLHLDDWKIGILMTPAVGEEGVTNALALWHQRNRWAEGGYQRYMDYWRWMINAPMGLKKKMDLLYFLFLQYILPTAAIPDLFMVITRHRPPLLTPVTGLLLFFSFLGMSTGLRRIKAEEKLSFANLMNIAWVTFKGTVYMMHWFVIIPSITARMSVRPKRLKWVKTVHQGSTQENFEF